MLVADKTIDSRIPTADFKLNFNPENSGGLLAIHERVAGRLHKCIVDNGYVVSNDLI